MKNSNFTYRFTTAQKPGEVFTLLLQVPEWWSGIYQETIEGKSEKLNDEFSFKAGQGAHFSHQKLVELVANKRVVWEVTDSNLSFLSQPDAWTGTKLSFDIASNGSGTSVTFTHEGLVPDIECYDACSNGWMQYMESLEKKLN